MKCEVKVRSLFEIYKTRKILFYFKVQNYIVWNKISFFVNKLGCFQTWDNLFYIVRMRQLNLELVEFASRLWLTTTAPAFTGSGRSATWRSKKLFFIITLYYINYIIYAIWLQSNSIITNFIEPKVFFQYNRVITTL